MSPLSSPTPAADIGFGGLLYRFFFFDWLFADITKARGVFEREAAWRHNRAMRRYLPTYLRRWAVVSLTALSLGYLFEQVLEGTLMAACCYTGFSLCVPVMVTIAVAWMFLAGWDRERR